LRRVKSAYLALVLLVSIGIVFTSVKYFSPDFDTGFLIGKREIFSFYKYALYTHVISSPISIIIALFQLGYTSSKYHKAAGRIYVITVLLFAAPSGLFMSFFAIGGFTGILLFSSLSLLWFYYTLKGYLAIRHHRINRHKKWMVGSFLLANSAVLLRINSFVIHQFDLFDPITNYLIAAFLSWVPALVIHEIKARNTV